MKRSFILLIAMSFVSILEAKFNENLTLKQKKEWNKLYSALCLSTSENGTCECFNVIEKIEPSQSLISLDDGSKWKVNHNPERLQRFKVGDPIKLYYNPNLKNVRLTSKNGGVSLELDLVSRDSKKGYFIARIPSADFIPKGKQNVMILNESIVFSLPKNTWKVRDQIMIFNGVKGYDLWNVTQKELVKNVQLLGSEKQNHSIDIATLDERLETHVLGQTPAVEEVCGSLYNHWNGLKSPETPIGVFLFLGPTGVGKTELAKAIATELFGSQKGITRFDMASFQEHDQWRLIGSPPGILNNEEGGRLTNALKQTPQSVILLDEIEKAHPKIFKLFLPAFDEGYICDARNNKFSCKECIFVLTSNLCSTEIAEMLQMGLSSEDVLQQLEPTLMNYLSPELYARLSPVIFSPLTEQVMWDLVERHLNEVKQRFIDVRNITLYISDDVKQFLFEKGYQPHLGARPLKKLIDKVLIAKVSKAIIKESIPDYTTIYIDYAPYSEERWVISWN